MKTLTLCLIVKNEEKVLARALSNALEYADQIVVADTGSTDRTVEIAKECGAEVHYFEWTNSFADARNFAFSKAKSQFVMWLDADDVVPKESVKEILKWKNGDLKADTLMCKYVTSEENASEFWFYRERIMLNCKLAVWVGRIHEVVAPFGKVEYSDIKILHRPVGVHTKRNLAIFRQMKKDGVNFSARETYYYARELYYAGFYKKALKTLKTFLTFENCYPPDVVECNIIMHNIYISLNNSKKAKTCLTQALMASRPRSDVCCFLGNMYLEQKNYHCAIDWYTFATMCKSNEGFISETYRGFTPYMQLVVCFDRLGDREQAYKYHLKAKEIAPTNRAVLFNEEYFKSLK